LINALHAFSLPYISKRLPLDITYFGLNVDFNVMSDDELSLNYEISSLIYYESELFEKDCLVPLVDTPLTLSNSTRSFKNSSVDTLVLAYDVDKGSIGSSRIWNALTNQIEFCQIVRLFIPGTNSSLKMVIEEDERVLTIDLDLLVDYETDNSLGAKTTGEGSGAADVDSYVQACKCDSVQSFTCDSSPLLPNAELIVCIWSVSPDVEINLLESMVRFFSKPDICVEFAACMISAGVIICVQFVTQDETTINVILNDEVQVPRITSREYVAGVNGVAVMTGVPTNLISFRTGLSITITGVVEMKLVEETGLFKRKLVVADSGEKLDREASYEMKVDLEEPWLTDSTSVAKNMSFVSLGIIIISTLAM